MRAKVPVDFDLLRHDDERLAARAHLDALSLNDVVVYDRGYFSQALVREHLARGLHAVFRLQANANAAVCAFVRSTDTERVVQTGAGERATLRLVKYEVAGSPYVLGTTLLDRERYPIAELSDLYHERWGIEELYKVSKHTLGIEDFHGQSERGVKQELFAHFVLITLTRLLSNHGEDQLGADRAARDPTQVRVSFTNSLLTVARPPRGAVPPARGGARQNPLAHHGRDGVVPPQAAPPTGPTRDARESRSANGSRPRRRKPSLRGEEPSHARRTTTDEARNRILK